jgi:hypothetical protein
MGMQFWFEKAEAEMQALEGAVVAPGAYSLYSRLIVKNRV